jgi:hypothetical protein
MGPADWWASRGRKNTSPRQLFPPHCLRTIMMDCANHRLSHATLRLRIFRQIYTSNTGSRFLSRSISTSPAQLSQAHDKASFPTPPAPSSSTKDYIPLSQSLPQSPVITHPRSGIKKVHKPRSEPEDIAELKKNPWAAALASPVRFMD